MTNVELIRCISLIGYLVIGMIPAPARTQPSRTVELSDIKIPARMALRAGCYNAYYLASATLKKVYQTIDSSAPSLRPRGLEFVGNMVFEK